MASVRRDPSRRQTPWVCRWRDETGAQRKKGFARKVDADRFKAEVEHTQNTGTYIDPAAGQVQFRPYAEEWRAAQNHRPNTATRVESGLRVHAYPAFGSRPMAAFRHTQLQTWVTGLDLKPSSVRPLWASVQAVFAAAVRDRIIGIDPSDGVKLPELDVTELELLTLDQVEGMADAVPDRYRAMVEADAGCGLRQGEMFGLEVGHIDFLRRTIRVEQQIQPAKDTRVVVCKPKNRHSYRPVAVGHAVIDSLARHLAAYPAQDVEVLDTTGRRPVLRMAKLVFTDDRARPLRRQDFNRDVWEPARAAVGVPWATQHDLRHFFASLLIRGGLSAKAVSKLLGHASPAETWRTYVHLWPDDEDRSREAVDAILRHVPTLRPSLEA